MARKTKVRKKAKATANTAAPVANDPKPNAKKDRREVLTTLGLYGVGLAVLGGGGTAFARDFMRNLDEQDLTRIGQGTPTIVQIHDPSCGLCRSLQRETRQALKTFDKADVTYLVANITSAEGAAFAQSRGLGHVTLVLMDGAGTQLHTIHGVTPAAELETSFAQYLGLGPQS